MEGARQTLHGSGKGRGDVHVHHLARASTNEQFGSHCAQEKLVMKSTTRSLEIDSSAEIMRIDMYTYLLMAME